MIIRAFTKKSIQPIGLDIGHSTINMVQFSASGEDISVIAAEKIKLDRHKSLQQDQHKDMLNDYIGQMLSKGRFCGRKVVTALSNEQLHITSLRLPQMNETETEKAVRKEAAERFGLDSEEDIVDYVFAGQVKQADETKNELIVFAAAAEAVQAHISVIEEAGLIPVAIEPIPCALFRSFKRSLRRQEDQEKTLVFVDVGAHFTTVVFGKGAQITFVKEIPIGAERFDKEVSDKLGVSIDEAEMLRISLRHEKKQQNDRHQQGQTATAVGSSLDVSTRQAIVDAVNSIAQELVREISLCFRYYTVSFRGKRIERAVFAGGGAYESILLDVLKRQLTVDVETAEPFRGFDISRVNFDSEQPTDFCEWAVSAGLAFRGLNSGEDGYDQ
ncbi:MAG: type IV pilus assembly protein PilM [Sedimentisphaerales bacterium]|nr:type IV pilus assembly protein PilM [Sedimentisphaerales bacterium]